MTNNGQTHQEMKRTPSIVEATCLHKGTTMTQVIKWKNDT